MYEWPRFGQYCVHRTVAPHMCGQIMIMMITECDETLLTKDIARFFRWVQFLSSSSITQMALQSIYRYHYRVDPVIPQTSSSNGQIAIPRNCYSF